MATTKKNSAVPVIKETAIRELPVYDRDCRPTNGRIIMDSSRTYFVNYENRIRKCRILEMWRDECLRINNDQRNKHIKCTKLLIAGIGEVTFTNSENNYHSFSPGLYLNEQTARDGGTFGWGDVRPAGSLDFFRYCKSTFPYKVYSTGDNYYIYVWTWKDCNAKSEFVKSSNCDMFRYDYLTGKFTISLHDGYYATKEECEAAHKADLEVVDFDDNEIESWQTARQQRMDELQSIIKNAQSEINSLTL